MGDLADDMRMEQDRAQRIVDLMRKQQHAPGPGEPVLAQAYPEHAAASGALVSAVMMDGAVSVAGSVPDAAHGGPVIITLYYPEARHLQMGVSDGEFAGAIPFDGFLRLDVSHGGGLLASYVVS